MYGDINYSLSWEDPRLILESLSISRNDAILTICSGGEHIFAMLNRNPKKIIALDSNPSQIKLLRLKIAALKNLDFDSFARFLGYSESEQRLSYFLACKRDLPQEDIHFWMQHERFIKKGIIHMGRFERYLYFFRKHILPLMHSKEEIEQLLDLSFGNQKVFYDQIWNTFRWKFFFKLFFSEYLLQFGRKKEYFLYRNIQNIAKHYLQRTEYALTQVPIHDNYFLYFILMGKIPIPYKGHPYLDEKNFHICKKRLERIDLVNDNFTSFVQQSKSIFSKYHLSDIFEPVSQEAYEKILLNIMKTAKKGSKICYWNNLTPRFEHPTVLNLEYLKKLSEKLLKKDRVFFYSRFMVELVQ